jgi:glycosyltransferase involved in cell wall biosynthesis
MVKIDLHLVSWNRPDITNLVIRTIKNNTKPENYRLVVLDNGSDQKTVEMLENLEKAGYIDELLPIKTNLGLEAARQFLLENCTQSDYFICVDNDCLPPKPVGGQDWIERLMELMQKHEDYRAISARTQVMIGTGNIFEEADKNGDDIVDFPHPGGSLRIMDTKITYFVGGWKPASPGRGAEERLICGKMRDAGFKTAFATEIKTLHLFGNRERTKERWGYSEDLNPEDTGHSDIAHPALEQGDFKDEVLLYASQKDTQAYFA